MRNWLRRIPAMTRIESLPDRLRRIARRSPRYWLWGAVLAVLVLAWLLLFWLPGKEADSLRKACITRCSFEQEKEVLRLRDEVRATGAQMLGGLILLLSAFAAWRNVMQQREGQITSRFTAAIAQLGATHRDSDRPVIEVRMGGIFALEQIATDAPEKYHRQVFEVLTAYVRENARKTNRPVEPNGSGSAVDEASSNAHEGQRLREDIQAALAVIARRTVRFELESEDPKLRGIDLRGADLRYAQLDLFDLSGSDMQDVFLLGASLIGALLLGTRFNRANLRDARLHDAHLMRADLQECILIDAKFQDAKLANSNLHGAVLRGANLENAGLTGAILTAADLEGVQGLGRGQLCRSNFDETTWLTDGQNGRTKHEVCVEKVAVPGLLDD